MNAWWMHSLTRVLDVIVLFLFPLLFLCLFMHSSTHPPIHPSTHPPNHPSIPPSVGPAVLPSIYPSIQFFLSVIVGIHVLFLLQSIHVFIDLFICLNACASAIADLWVYIIVYYYVDRTISSMLLSKCWAAFYSNHLWWISSPWNIYVYNQSVNSLIPSNPSKSPRFYPPVWEVRFKHLELPIMKAMNLKPKFWEPTGLILFGFAGLKTWISPQETPRKT